MSTESDFEHCEYCGMPAKGFAQIEGKRYCHEGDDPTCYMSKSWENTTVKASHPVTERARPVEGS